MTAPSYSLLSLTDLAERDSRHGRDVSAVAPTVRKAMRALQKLRRSYVASLTGLKADDQARVVLRANYMDSRRQLRVLRDAAVEEVLREALSSFEAKFESEDFHFGLVRGPVVGKKQTYGIDSAVDVAFPAKQAAQAIRSQVTGSLTSRNSIVRALKESLRRDYSHAVYRTDLTAFFESIPHAALIERVAQSPNIDGVTTHLVRQLLLEYQNLVGEARGLPRGVGLSSQLAEFYLCEFDLLVRTHPGVLFFARYVDDVVLIAEDEHVLEAVKVVLSDELKALGLHSNPMKTVEIKTDSAGNYPPGDTLEYLGYQFSRAGGLLATGLTGNRKRKRSVRLDLAFKSWQRTNPRPGAPNHGHDGLLVDRVRYLAGNTRLVNSKSSVAIGLYHSNSALDPGAKELLELDDSLAQFLRTNSGLMTDSVLVRLQSISFARMFEERPFLRFQQGRLEQMTRIWKEVGA